MIVELFWKNWMIIIDVLSCKKLKYKSQSWCIWIFDNQIGPYRPVSLGFAHPLPPSLYNLSLLFHHFHPFLNWHQQTTGPETLDDDVEKQVQPLQVESQHRLTGHKKEALKLCFNYRNLRVEALNKKKQHCFFWQIDLPSNSYTY